MTKYSAEVKEKVLSELRECIRRGLTPHRAAKEVSQHSPIALLSLRFMAYAVAKELGRGPAKPIQHSLDSEHGSLLLKCRSKLQGEGYNVVWEQNEIRKVIEGLGSKGNPDLLAFRGDEVVLVEIVERGKGAATFVDQIERFSAVGKVLVVLPVDVGSIELWGPRQLAWSPS